MAVKRLPQVFHHVGPDVNGAADDPVGDGLDSLGDSAEDPQLLAAEAELGTLQVRHLEIEIIHQIKIDERDGGYWQTLA